MDFGYFSSGFEASFFPDLTQSLLTFKKSEFNKNKTSIKQDKISPTSSLVKKKTKQAMVNAILSGLSSDMSV